MPIPASPGPASPRQEVVAPARSASWSPSPPSSCCDVEPHAARDGFAK